MKINEFGLNSSLYNTISYDIQLSNKTKAYYIDMVDTWFDGNYIDLDEKNKCVALINEKFPD